MSERRRSPRLTGALSLLALLGVPMLAVGAETRSESVERIVRQAPRGSEERTAWLMREAAATRDAGLAFELVEEVVRRAPREAAAPARLWKVRYWMAAGRTDQAVLDLQVLGRVPEDAPWAPETSYWRALLGMEGEPGAAVRGEIPPWGLMAQLAALRGVGEDRARAREVLALEGAVRRLGLLGPWLWKLLREGEPGLRRSVRETVSGSARSLEAAPERIALARGSQS